VLALININLLPKHLQRVHEPAHWKLIAVLFPLAVLIGLGAMQFTISQREKSINREIVNLEIKNQKLQESIREQRRLQAESQRFRNLLSIRDQVRNNQISWTAQISNLLETLPAQGSLERPLIDFDSLNMQSVDPPRADSERYEGQVINAEINVSGQVKDTQALANFIEELESSDKFGVDFQSTTRDSENDIYSYSLTVGSLTGGSEE